MNNSWKKDKKILSPSCQFFSWSEAQLQIIFKPAPSFHFTKWVHDPKETKELEKACSSRLFFH